MGKKKRKVSNYNTSPSAKKEHIKVIFKEAAKERRRRTSQTEGANLDVLDLDSLRQGRRITALANTIDPVIEKLCTYDPTYPKDNVYREWIGSNALVPVGYDELNNAQDLETAITIWIVDQLKKAKTLTEAVRTLDSIFSKTVHTQYQDMMDISNSGNLMTAVCMIIQNRNDDCVGIYEKKVSDEPYRIFMDCWTAAGLHKQDVPSRITFETLMSFIPTDVKKDAVSYYKEKCFQWIDRYYKTIIPIMQEIASINKQIQALKDDNAAILDNVMKEATQFKPVYGQRPLSTIPSSFLKGKENDKKIQDLHLQWEQLSYRANDVQLFNPMLQIATKEECIDIFGEEVIDIWADFRIEDPYKLIFGFFYALDEGSDLPWLYFPSVNVLLWAVDCLPWATQNINPIDYLTLYREGGYDELTNLDLMKHRKTTPEDIRHLWYDMHYKFTDPETGKTCQLNMAQILFSMTGGILPRDVDSTLTALKVLDQCGICTENEGLETLATCIALMENLQHREEEPFLVAVSHTFSDVQNEADVLAQENESLKESIARLKKELYEAEKKAKHLKTSLEKNEKNHSLERQELIDLRELVFNQQEDSYTEEPSATKISFPCNVQKRVLVFGGHDSWSREIRQKLPNVRFIDKTMKPNPQLIRNAEVVWIQPNALSHSFFYAIVDEVRKNNIPLRYFSYASATKCAEQLVEADAT